jgi:hypothetical protein
MNRLELLHTIQENADQLSTHDAFALLASRLPSDPAVHDAWHQLAAALIANRDA